MDALGRYIARRDTYVSALTRKSVREAMKFLETGEMPAELVAPLVEAKEDGTRRALAAYRERLSQLAQHGRYSGPTALRRLRPDGSWEPLPL